MTVHTNTRDESSNKRTRGGITWLRFWQVTEKGFDEMLTVGATFLALKLGGFLPIGWTSILSVWSIAFAGSIACGTIAAELKTRRAERLKLFADDGDRTRTGKAHKVDNQERLPTSATSATRT